MLKKTIGKGAVVLALLLAFASPLFAGGSSEKEAAPAQAAATTTTRNGEKVVTIAQTGNWDTFMPMNTTNQGSDNILDLLFERLMIIKTDGTFEPRLASSWEVNETSDVITYHLNENAKWHDGEPVTAQDVVYSAQVASSAEYAYPRRIRMQYFAGTDESGMESIEADADVPSMEEEQTASPFGIDDGEDSGHELHDDLDGPSAPADDEPSASDGMREPGDELHGYDGSAMETTKAENASDHAEDQEEPGMEEAPEEADPAIADGLEESLEPAADEDEASAAAFEAEEPEPAAASDENALPEEIEAPASPAESPSDEPDEAIGSEMLSDEAIVFEEADDAEEPSSDMPMAGGGEETTETLIDKGLVKQVEADGEGSAFVMTEANEEASEPAEEVPESPNFPGILGEIASYLESGSAFVSFLSSSDGEMLDYLGKVIRSSWEREQADGKDKMFSIYDCSISVLIAANKVNDELRKEELLNNAGAVMYSRHKDRWHALILSIDEDFHILDAYERTISPDSFSASNWKICRIIGEQLIARGR